MKLDSQTASRAALTSVLLPALSYWLMQNMIFTLDHQNPFVVWKAPTNWTWSCGCADVQVHSKGLLCPHVLASCCHPLSCLAARAWVGNLWVGRVWGSLGFSSTDRLHRHRCVQRKREQQMDGEGLLFDALWGLAQAHLWHFHLLNDFRHFVAVLALRREGECGCCDGLMDTRRLLFFPSTCSLPSLGGHYCSRCFVELLFHQCQRLNESSSAPTSAKIWGTHMGDSKATSSPMVSLTASSFCKLN